MVQPVVAESVHSRSYGLDALAIPRPDQARDIGRAHLSAGRVTKVLQIRLEPTLKVALPIPFHRQPPSKLAPYELRISERGNP